MALLDGHFKFFGEGKKMKELEFLFYMEKNGMKLLQQISLEELLLSKMIELVLSLLLFIAILVPEVRKIGDVFGRL